MIETGAHSSAGLLGISWEGSCVFVPAEFLTAAGKPDRRERQHATESTHPVLLQGVRLIHGGGALPEDGARTGVRQGNLEFIWFLCSGFLSPLHTDECFIKHLGP